MKDTIRQEINVGDKVLWARMGYAGANLFSVVRFTAKRVKLERTVGGRMYTADPQNLIVVTSNLQRFD